MNDTRVALNEHEPNGLGSTLHTFSCLLSCDRVISITYTE